MMGRCSHSGKKIKCPHCGSGRVAFFYDVDKTIIYCQAVGCYRRSTTKHHSDPDFGKEWE